MSFLDSVLTSIETGKPSAIPSAASRRPEPPISSTTAKSEVRKPSTPSRDASSEKKVAAAGTKRKAEEQLQRPSKPDIRVPGKPVPTRPVPTRPAPTRPGTASTAPKPRPNSALNAANSASSSNTTTTPKAATVSSKPPPPGSFADLMMKAKTLQQKAPTQVGMFKHQHQTAPKERLSKMERKKRAMEAQAKEKDPRLAKKGGATAGTPGVKSGDGKPARKRDPDEPTYRGTARPTPTPATTEYRGTAGLPAKRDPAARQQFKAGKRSRMDEYLATDEEDEGEYANEQDDYYSDASSDMEAGFDNVEEEEQAALKLARREDEEEWHAELAAKKEKLERKKKLTSLASRAR